MTFFLVITYFTHHESYSCFLDTTTPYMHTHMLFSRSYTLLCALETAHTPYTIYFALIHHCTNSLSSLHIFVHHCTFCASLHTKTSPASSMCRLTRLSCTNCVNYFIVTLLMLLHEFPYWVAHTPGFATCHFRRATRKERMDYRYALINTL